jgi:hypothetical protein
MGPAGRGPEYMRSADLENTPFHIWHDLVFELAGVSVEEGRKYATRERIQRAYQMGEKAWMAADMVRQFVRGGRLVDRGDAEVEGLRRMIRSSFSKSRSSRTGEE